MNLPPIGPKLERVISFGPAEVIDKVIHRNMNDSAARFCLQWGQAGKIDIVPGTDSPQAKSLPGIAKPNVIHEVLTDCPGVTYGNSLGVVV
jgi:hypothetical protein